MWLKIIGSFLASIFGSFWHDRSVRKAEDEKVAGHEAEQTVNIIEKSHEAQIEFDSGHVPAAVAERVRAQYID